MGLSIEQPGIVIFRKKPNQLALKFRQRYNGNENQN